MHFLITQRGGRGRCLILRMIRNMWRIQPLKLWTYQNPARSILLRKLCWYKHGSDRPGAQRTMNEKPINASRQTYQNPGQNNKVIIGFKKKISWYHALTDVSVAFRTSGLLPTSFHWKSPASRHPMLFPGAAILCKSDKSSSHGPKDPHWWRYVARRGYEWTTWDLRNSVNDMGETTYQLVQDFFNYSNSMFHKYQILSSK